MKIALIDLETGTCLDLVEGDAAEAARLNDQAQAVDENLEWRAVSPFAAGMMTAQLYLAHCLAAAGVLPEEK